MNLVDFAVHPDKIRIVGQWFLTIDSIADLKWRLDLVQ